MRFTIAIFLYAYFVFLAIYALLALFNLYHIFKYGVKNFATFFATFLFLTGLVVILNFSLLEIQKIDWSAAIPVNFVRPDNNFGL